MTQDEEADISEQEECWEVRRPDTPEEAAVRAFFDAQLRERYGQEWLDANKGLLDAEWEYVKHLL
jgi:hypothetical protein